ncbi:MAG TPA: Do family serine endopeptidase [Blastocatellia bacterium]|nr:Do family serine endopeptidase [Blastocatellia bacterium]
MQTEFDHIINVNRRSRVNWTLMGILGAVVLLVGAIFGSAATARGWFKNSNENKVPIYVSSDSQINQQITLSGGFAPIAKAVTPAVVVVNVKSRKQQSPFFIDPFSDLFGNPDQEEEGTPRRVPLPRQQPPQGRAPLQPQGRAPLQPSGTGSGVIVSPDGYIITNNHVVDGADKVEVELADGREFVAKVIGTDPPSDVAVIKIDAASLPTVPFGDSDKVEVGDLVLAVGNPLGIGQTVTMGIISAKGRRSPGGTDRTYENFLQTDAAINRGNSGGALVNLRGELVGIPSQILSQSGGSIGIGFAIPTKEARNVMDQLLRNGKVRRGMLGVNIRSLETDLAEAFGYKGTKGAFIENVVPGQPADQAGIKRGDIITEFQGQRIDTSDQLRNLASQTPPGTTVKVKVWREGAERELSLKLSERDLSANIDKENVKGNGESSAAGGVLSGVRVEPLTPETAQRFRLPASTRGVLITDVDPSSNAAAAGLQRGMAIEEVAKQPVSNLGDFNAALQKLGNKKSVLLSIVTPRGSSYIVVKDEE